MRAAIYARVSTERQGRQQTIDSQLDALRTWVASHEHILDEDRVFRDEGYSGARLDRPGLDALRDVVRDGAVELVAVLSPDRLARRYAYQVLLLEEFRRAGCEVAFLHHPISQDPNDQLLLQIQGAIAEYERAVLGERFRRGKLQKARDGHYLTGRAAYGYRYVPRCGDVPGRLLVDEREAELVRMLYGWLTDERMTIRQIIKRLNAGPHLPRSGRHAWSPSTVQHILSDPIYTGTAYANRYTYVPATKPRRIGAQRSPRTGEATCRRLKPREQWIAIPVQPLVDMDTWDRAQEQLARNAALSFRNNTRHSYLLRCLLTCEACGLAMYGITRPATVRLPQRQYYECHGKDCILSARTSVCPSRTIKAETIEQAVWQHVASLLAEPARLLAQFDRLAATEAGSPRDRAAEQRLRSRMERIIRADGRLLDAYQAEAINLSELTERRRQLAKERQDVERQREEHARLRQQWLQAETVRTDLAEFCSRMRDRLDQVSFADKQAILQLLIERIIVGNGRLEIRHVIPLRPPPPSGSGPASPPERLRSDGVHAAALPGGAEDAGDRALQPFMGVGDDQLHAAQAALDQTLEEGGPEGLGLGGADVQTDDLAPPLGVAGHGDYRRDRDHPPALALAQVGGVQPEVGPFARQRPVEEGRDALVDVLAELRDGGLRDAGQPHGLDQVVHPPCRDPADPGLLDHRHQRLLRGLPGLEEGREIGPLPELGDAQLHRAEAGVEGAVPIAVAPVQPLAGALVAPRADQALHVGLHQDLQHRLGDAAQEVAVSGLRQKLGQWQSLLGHRSLGWSGGGSVATPP
jgi:site-specific DNA recombinase